MKKRIENKLENPIVDHNDDNVNPTLKIKKSKKTEEKGKKIKVTKQNKEKQNDKLQELKNILGNKPTKKITQKSIPDPSFYDDINVKDYTYISKNKYDDQFRGWGFSFFS